MAGLSIAKKGPTGAELKQAFLDSIGEEESGLLRACIYGNSGVGKTVLAAQIAQAITDKPVLWFDTAVGFQSLYNHPTDINLAQFTRVSYQGLSMLDTFAALYQQGDPDFTKYGCIVMDEHSSMHKVNLDRIVQARHVDDPAEERDAAKLPDFGIAATQMYRTTNKFLKAVDTHVIFLAHMRDDPDEKKRLITRPDYQPGFSRSFKELLSVLGYMNATSLGGEYTRTIQCHPSIKLSAKTRIPGLPVEASPERFIQAVNTWIENKGRTSVDSDVFVDVSHSINDDNLDSQTEESGPYE